MGDEIATGVKPSEAMAKITLAHGARELAKQMAKSGVGEAKIKTKQSVKVKLRRAFGKDE